MPKIVIAACTALALALAGCGGDDDDEKTDAPATQSQQAPAQPPPTQAVPKAAEQDIEAQANAGALSTELETCFADEMDYRECKEPPDSIVPLGSKPGQAEVTEADESGYTVVAHSESGNDFMLTKTPAGAKQTCKVGGPDEGRCIGGKW